MISAVDSRVFPAKLLLFGEHVLLLGATALAVPVHAFEGSLVYSLDEPTWRQHQHHQARLMQFAQSEALSNLNLLNTALFAKDLESGLFFRSNIPTGYGLGSSGALCAAVYDRYALKKTVDLGELKRIFAAMESFFHGNSSGIDPLTSYLGQPVLIQNKTEVQLAKTREWEGDKPIVFLLDSRLPRRTGPLVQWFLAQNEQAEFARKLAEEYLPAHEALLKAWLFADVDLLWTNLRRVSLFQLEHFVPMIPETLSGFWAENMENPDVVLKICGAGGGGFVLGFAKNLAALSPLADRFELLYPFDRTIAD